MPFYKDRTIRLIVGLAPGGGYDLYSRVIARHLGKHIPGNPTIVVENMPGAGSVIAANYMFKAAKPDGLTPRGPSWTSIPMMARGWSETSKRSLISSLR
jgi:tripartite-type tricarboxylate transporter receptor subunit TctC